MPKVSILIPVFNREEFIADCIQSALNQTFSDFEIVVVDNASNDATWEICKAFAVKDDRVRVFRNDYNIGPVRNWIRCIDEANGEFGKFLFSDDLMLSDYLSETIPNLEKDDIGFVYTAAFIGQDIESGEVHYAGDQEKEIITTSSYFESLLNNYSNIPISPGAAVFRKKDIKKNLLSEISTYQSHNFNDNGAGPDVLIYALTAISYKYVLKINKPLVLFRVHKGSFTVSSDQQLLAEGYRLALAWFFKNYSSTNNWADWIVKIWFNNFKKSRVLVSPFYLIKRYEGKGDFVDIYQLFIAIIRLIKKRWF